MNGYQPTTATEAKAFGQIHGLQGRPNGLSLQNAEIRQPSVLRELAHLEKAVAELQAIFPQLEAKIERVTRQEPEPCGKDEYKEESPTVQLAENIAEQRRAIQRLSARIVSLIQRVEL